MIFSFRFAGILFAWCLIMLALTAPTHRLYAETLQATDNSVEIPARLEVLKNRLSSKALKVQDALSKKVQTLKSSLKIESSQLKKQLIDPPITQYKLEQRIFAEPQHYTFQKDIRPILNNKCLACHGCYDAPCQLKMETASGLARGASKIKIYDGGRLRNLPPTRLDIDYQSTKDWRAHGFYPIINGYPTHAESTPSLMRKMLDLSRARPLPANKKIPADIQLGLTRKNSCAAPDQFEQYAKDNPHGGMPLAFTGLTDHEYMAVSTWLKEGAKLSSDPRKPNQLQQAMVSRWESWLNRKDRRSQLVARYLYEHLFLAHLYLDDARAQTNTAQPPLFFRLIRSSTPSGHAPVPVRTTRPNDAVPGAFYYRLQPVKDTLVNKTHIAYAFGAARMTQFQRLFFTPEWSVQTLPGYSEAERGNPFETFSALPARIRYRFLLNDAAFFVRNFIRGPVCRGQIATDVIRDQFWIMFEAPEYERYTHDAEYQRHVNPLLGVPGQNVSLTDFGSQWISYHNDRNKYIDEREQEYNRDFPHGAGYAHIWKGDKTNKNAFQTIFRHHDSASIVQGWRGAMPQTSWLLDYPLFERTIYELVVGFNVFGNVSHQAQTRLYFDLIRNEGETNFLRFMPASARDKLYQQWYTGSGQIATLVEYHELDTKTPSAIKFDSTAPYAELLQQLMKDYPDLTQASDVINRCSGPCLEQQNDDPLSKINQALRLIAAKPAQQIPAIGWLPDVSFLRVNLPNGNYRVYSLIRNRMHSNVAFMLGESLRLEASLDTLTIEPTLIGSYPNLLFQIESTEIAAFVHALAQASTEDDFEQVITQWGIRRMNPEFWALFHSFNHYMEQHQPLEAGIYDLNRYGRY